MGLILEKDGVPFPDKPVGQRYAEALQRSARETKLSLWVAMSAGWTPEDYDYWVQTGEEPPFE